MFFNDFFFQNLNVESLITIDCRKSNEPKYMALILMLLKGWRITSKSLKDSEATRCQDPIVALV